ncbi:MAG: YhcH/YjgK/YiaL family protein [Candidatus Gastranaerophilales bacterium]|nr:YhcH/YjgK/YiaL family protein [Candidatus Gastranaerophilales bacterium]
MIKDTLDNAEKYFNLSPQIKSALLYLKNTDLKNIEIGRHYLDGDNMYVNVDEYETKISDNIEAHRKYIDIQYIISGEEQMGVSLLKNLTPITEYDEEKDIIFYNGKADLNLVKENEFIIFYPEDAHLPCQMIDKAKKVKKAVVKIKIN